MPHRKRVVVAANPRAGSGAAVRAGARTIDALRADGHDVVVVDAADAHALEEALRAHVEAGADALVLVGGDGTVHLGINAVAGTQTAVGIVPTGSGNDLIRSLGLPVGDLDATLAQLLVSLQMAPREIDTVQVDGGPRQRRYGTILSAGFDAYVHERAERLRYPTGGSRYAIAVFVELAMLKPRHYRLQLDDETLEFDAMLVAVANSSHFGAGMRVAPQAAMDDGFLDVVTIAPCSRLEFVRAFPRVYRGDHLTHPKFSVRRARRVRIESDDLVAWADGERMGSLPLQVEVVPRSLRLLA